MLDPLVSVECVNKRFETVTAVDGLGLENVLPTHVGVNRPAADHGER